MPEMKKKGPAPKPASATAKMSEFCKKNEMGSDDFMSNTGWLKQGSWRTSIDWKEVSGWKGFGNMISGGAPRQAQSGQKAAPKDQKTAKKK